MKNTSSRREFMKSTVKTGMAAGIAAIATTAAARRKPPCATAASQERVAGANERINIGLIGCGGRGRWIVQNMLKPDNKSTSLIAANDIWRLRQTGYPNEAEKQYGHKPKMYTDYRELLEDADVDAVIIGTPAHQHCGQTIDAVNAGKHVYVEKPIAPVARDLEILNKCYDTVKTSKMMVQNGSQGVSCPAVGAVKTFIEEGTLGKLFRIESTESLPVPYWLNYKGPGKEEDTDWNAFLYGREARSFDAHQHASWMGYHDFSSGPIGGWMSHFINYVHFVTGCGMPVACTAFGGNYALSNDPRCDAPDQVSVTLEYKEGFHTQFVTHFGSSIENESTLFMFEKGSMRTGFGHNIKNATYSSEGVDGNIEAQKLLEADAPYPGGAHIANWLDCIRNGGTPNADMEFGYKQGIAVLLGDTACSIGKRVTFDEKKREIVPV